MVDDDHREARERAHSIIAGGVAVLAHAFNTCDNADVPYKYDAQTLRRFTEIVCELRDLAETGGIAATLIGTAWHDVAFQRFLSDVTTRRRRKRRAS